MLDAAHFVVVTRPGVSLQAALARTPELAARARPHTVDVPELRETSILLVEARTRDVASTAVRARLAAGEPIADLVPAPVARHITANHLYGAVDELHG